MRSALLVTGALFALVGAGVTVLVPDASAAGLLLTVCGAVLTQRPTLPRPASGYTAPAEHDARQVQP